MNRMAVGALFRCARSARCECDATLQNGADLDVAERDAFVECVKAFVENPPTEKAFRINIGWYTRERTRCARALRSRAHSHDGRRGSQAHTIGLVAGSFGPGATAAWLEDGVT